MKRLSRFMLCAFVFSTTDIVPIDARQLAVPGPEAQVRTGRQHACALGSDAPVVCRGSTAEQTTHPRVASITLPERPVPFGAWVDISAAISDANPGEQHSATIEWGDGSITELHESGSPVLGSHRYAVGIYTVTVRVTDGERSDTRSSSAEQTTSYVVVYDPSASYVTGNGWVQSEPGWCRLDAACKAGSGRAVFGFVFHYQKRLSAPVGHARLQFQDGGFSFKSVNHDWLAVSGARAQFRGSGTVNDEAGYDFLLTVNDHALVPGSEFDRFRLKIWKKASGRVVYDNRRGTISGGSITIKQQPALRVDNGVGRVPTPFRFHS